MSLRLNLYESSDLGASYKYVAYSGREYIGTVSIVCHCDISEMMIIATNVEGFYTGYLATSGLNDVPEHSYESEEEPSSDLEFTLLELAETLVGDLG